MKLTLAFSPCPNDTFIFDALIHKRIDTMGYDFEVILSDVEQLNQKAFQAEADITKLSFYAWAFASQNYQILNSGSALGKGCGPLLITTEEKLNYPVSLLKTAIPGKFTTANFLLSSAYPELTNKQDIIFSEIENAVLDGRFDAGLLIHENRFTYELKGLKLIRDLGQYWENFSGLPIPLGAIAIKRSFDQQIKNDIDSLIKKSIEFAFENPSVSLPYTQLHAQSMNPKVMQQHIALYVNKYSLNIGKEGKKAIRTLLQTALNLNLIPQPVEPVFV